MAYEALLLAALLFGAALAFLPLGRALEQAYFKPLFQIYLVAVCGAYFVICWHRTGQTLPMKTWHLRLSGPAGERVSVPRAAARFLLALATLGTALAALLAAWALRAPSMAALGGCLAVAALGWAALDRDRQFLHDRLAGTRIITTRR
jgi:uncharacterized RDD family membrane protein YckC